MTTESTDNKQFGTETLPTPLTFAPTLAFLGALILAGLVGNSIAFLVYYRRFKSSSTRVFILAMSACDLTTNIVSLPMDFFFRFQYYDFDMRVVCKVNGCLKSFLTVYSTLVLVAVARDRYQKVCRPLSRKNTLKNTYRTLIICTTCTLFVAAPSSVLIGLQTIQSEGDNRSTTCFVDDEFVGSLYLDIYAILTTLSFAGCFGVMSVCYGLIAWHLWKHKQRICSNTTLVQNVNCLEPGSSEINTPISVTENQTSGLAEASSISREENSVNEVGSWPHQLKTIVPNMLRENFKPNEERRASLPLECSGEVLKLRRSAPCLSGEFLNTTFSGNCTTQITKGGSEPEICLDGETGTDCRPYRREEAVSAAFASDKVLETYGQRGYHKGNIAKPIKGSAVASSLLLTSKSKSNCSVVSLPKPSSTSVPSVKPARGKKIPSRTTAMMFALTVLFILNFVPFLITIHLYEGRDLLPLEIWELNMYHIAVRSYFVNSAINPLVYCFFSTRFREECRDLFCGKVSRCVRK